MIRRRWFWAVLVLCAAALFVLFRVQRVGEDALRAEAERRLAETLQIDVHLGPLTLGLGEDLPWVDLEFQGVRLQWPEVTLEAQQVGVSVEPIALALGRLSMHGLHIDGLDVEWQDASTPAAGPSDPDEILARAREVGDWLSAHPCFLPDTTVRDAVVAQRHADERREWLIQVSGEYDCMTIRGRAEASLEGQLPGIPKTLKFGLDTRQDHFELTLNFPTLPLSQLAALVGTEKKLEGSLAGRLRVREKGEQALILDVEASGDALSGWLRGAGAAANSDRDIPELRAELQLEPDALRVLNAELNEGEKTYTVDAHLQGLQALAHFDPQRCAKPRALPDMPGIAGLQEWLEDQPDDATRQSSPTKSLELQLDVLAHPALFCTLEDFRAKLHWSATDLDLELEHAQFGGLTIAANLARSEQTAPGSGSHWRLEARLLAPLASPHPTDAPPTALPVGSWARGRIALSAMSLGALDVQGASAKLEARRSSLRLSELALHFEEQHAIHGHFQLALGEAVPRFRSDLRVTSVPADALATAFGAKATLVEGETNADLEIRGSLNAGQDLISNASGHLDFKISSGSLRARLPFLLALSAASPTSNPFRDRDRLNFETFDLAGSIADGQLELEKFKLDGPAISAISSGHVSLVDPYPADLELALFFLQRTSSLLQRVPVVGNLLLGDNGSLMGAVFAVDGSLSSPQVRLVPGRTFAESLPGALLRGIPTQLLEGARRVTSLAGSVTRDRATP